MLDKPRYRGHPPGTAGRPSPAKGGLFGPNPNALVMNSVTVTPDVMTRLLEEQQKAAVLKWVADPFGNLVKTFPINLPDTEKPYSLCLKVHEVKVPKSSSTRAVRLPDGGTVLANGTWKWGPGNEPPAAT